MGWFLLAMGIALEVAGTLCMKVADGFANWRAAAMMYTLYAASLTVLTLAFKHLEVSLAYAVWSGAGLVLIVSIGIVFFREPVTVLRLGFIALILIGLIGLRLAD